MCRWRCGRDDDLRRVDGRAEEELRKGAAHGAILAEEEAGSNGLTRPVRNSFHQKVMRKNVTFSGTSVAGFDAAPRHGSSGWPAGGRTPPGGFVKHGAIDWAMRAQPTEIELVVPCFIHGGNERLASAFRHPAMPYAALAEAARQGPSANKRSPAPQILRVAGYDEPRHAAARPRSPRSARLAGRARYRLACRSFSRPCRRRRA